MMHRQGTLKKKARCEAYDQFAVKGVSPGSCVPVAPTIPATLSARLLPQTKRRLGELSRYLAVLTADVTTKAWQEGDCGQGKQNRKQGVFDHILARFIFVQAFQHLHDLPTSPRIL